MSEANKKTNPKANTGRRRVVEWVILLLIAVVLVVTVLMSIEARRNNSEESSVANTSEESESAQSSGDTDTSNLPPIYVDYPGLGEDTVFERTPDSEVISTLREGSGVVFLGFPACPWCQGLAPVVDLAAKNAGLEEVKYLDIRESREQGNDTYSALVHILKDYLPTGDDGNSVIYVPDLTVVKDGEIIFRYEAEDAPQGENTPDTYWTEDRTNRVRQQLEAEFQTLAQE